MTFFLEFARTEHNLRKRRPKEEPNAEMFYKYKNSPLGSESVQSHYTKETQRENGLIKKTNKQTRRAFQKREILL